MNFLKGKNNFCTNTKLYNNTNTKTNTNTSNTELLLSLQETNHHNETTIQQLQQKLTEMTNERNAFRSNSERVMDALTQQKTKLEFELQSQRQEAQIQYQQYKHERMEWKEQACAYKDHGLLLEAEVKLREASLVELEERWMREEKARGERIKTLEGQVVKLVEMQMQKQKDKEDSSTNDCGAGGAAAVADANVNQDDASRANVNHGKDRDNTSSLPRRRHHRRRNSSPPDSPSSSISLSPEQLPPSSLEFSTSSQHQQQQQQQHHAQEQPQQLHTQDSNNTSPLQYQATLLASTLGFDMSNTSLQNATDDERNLHRAILEISALEAKFNSQIQQRDSHIDLMKFEVESWMEKHDRIEKKYHELEVEKSSFGECKSALECELKVCKATIEKMTKEKKEMEEEEEVKEQDWEDRLSRVLVEKDKLALENEQLKVSLASPYFKNSSVSCNASSASLSNINDELVERICELAEENSVLVDKCKELKSELNDLKSTDAKIKSRNHSLKSEWEKYQNKSVCSSNSINFKDSQPDLSSRVVELETSKATLEASIQRLLHDLESAKKDGIDTYKLIETLISENDSLRASSANQGKKREKIKNLVEHMKSSFSMSTSAMFNEDDELVPPCYSEDTKGKKFATPMEQWEHDEALAIIEEMQSENDTLRASMEEAIGLAGRMNEKMTNFVHSHESTIQEYEMKLTSLTEDLQQEKLSRDTWAKEKEELTAAMEGLKHDVEEAKSLVETCEALTGELSETNNSLKDAQEHHEQELKVEKESNNSLKAELERALTERTEAYDTLRILQEEIDLLRKSVNESRERAENLSISSGYSEATKDNRDKMRVLIKANSQLMMDLAKEQGTLQSLQSSFDSLKSENQTTKEMVVALRQENCRLRDGETNVPPTPPLRSILKPSSHGPKSSQVTDLESRIKKIEKENKGLKEAQETLSTKLFDEMEKNDELRIANEGLGARICKLVSFIKQNPVPPPAPQKKTAPRLTL